MVFILLSPSLSDVDWVFTKYLNYTGFDDNQPYTLPLVVLIGTLTFNNVMIGFEAPCTMAEETIDGAKAAPAALLKSLTLSSVGCFFLMLSMAFACRNSIDGILAGPTNRPEINLYAFIFTKNSLVN